MNPLTDSRKRFAKLLGIGALAGTLAACGGGVYVDIPIDDLPPEVDLAAAPLVARVGEDVRFNASAIDDGFVRRVSLYQVIPNSRDVLLDTDSSRPYEFIVRIPGNTPVGAVLAFYAVAEDDVGQTRSSNIVEIDVP